MAGSFRARSLRWRVEAGMSASLGGTWEPVSASSVVGSGKSGNPNLFLLPRSFLASSSSLRILDSSANRLRFSSRSVFRTASSSSSFRFLESLASRSRWMAACSSR